MSEGALDPGVGTCVGRLTINGINMHRKAFNVLTPIPAWYPPDLVGDNVRVSGVQGKRAYPLLIDQTDIIMPMMVSGLFLPNDAADPDGHFACLRRNFRYLRENVFGPADGVNATWYATIAYPWGELEEADVQVLDIGEIYQDVELVKTNITLRIPEGEFALVTS